MTDKLDIRRFLSSFNFFNQVRTFLKIARTGKRIVHWRNIIPDRSEYAACKSWTL